MRARPRALPLIAAIAALGACSTPTLTTQQLSHEDQTEILLDTSSDTTDIGRGGNSMGSGH
jgi:hypothetical protein